MMSPILSIIVPVYNTEKYLNKCIERLITSKYCDYEVLIINDGSTDNSAQICFEFETNYDVVKVITKENGGLSSARNCGIQNAKGKYLIFVDSDDCFIEGGIEAVLDFVHDSNEFDICEFGYNVYRNGIRERNNEPKLFEGNPQKYLYDVLNTTDYMWYAWKYIFSRELFNSSDYLFPLGINYEDVWLVPRLFFKARKLITVPKAIYQYQLARPGAITYGINFKNECNKLKVIDENINYFEFIKDENLKKELLNNFAKEYFSIMIILYSIKDLNNRRILFQMLKEKKYIIGYTCKGKQLYVKKLVSIIGIKGASYILHIRDVIQHG